MGVLSAYRINPWKERDKVAMLFQIPMREGSVYRKIYRLSAGWHRSRSRYDDYLYSRVPSDPRLIEMRQRATARHYVKGQSRIARVFPLLIRRMATDFFEVTENEPSNRVIRPASSDGLTVGCHQPYSDPSKSDHKQAQGPAVDSQEAYHRCITLTMRSD
jgi:hypothetical protein